MQLPFSNLFDTNGIWLNQFERGNFNPNMSPVPVNDMQLRRSQVHAQVAQCSEMNEKSFFFGDMEVKNS